MAKNLETLINTEILCWQEENLHTERCSFEVPNQTEEYILGRVKHTVTEQAPRFEQLGGLNDNRWGRMSCGATWLMPVDYTDTYQSISALSCSGTTR